MADVALYLGKLTVSEKTQLGRRIVKDMTGNAFFPKPAPSLTQITDVINAVDAAQITAASGSKEAIFQLNAQVKLLESILSQAAKYVEFASGGEESKIMSAGMSVKPKPSPIGPMPKPTDFKVVYTEGSGEFSCSLQAVKGAGSYIFQITATPEVEASWVNGAIATKSRIVISGLQSGTRYSIRCAAIGAAGQGPWSDVIQRYAQ